MIFLRFPFGLLLVMILITTSNQDVLGQDSAIAGLSRMQRGYISDVNGKVTSFNKEVDGLTEKSLDELIAQERKMQSKVAKIDSVKAKALFLYSIDSLKHFKTLIKKKTGKLGRFFKGGYFPYFDSVKTSLAFLNKANSVADQAGAEQAKLTSSLSQVDQMQAKLGTVDQINEYLKQRQAVLQAELTNVPGLSGSLQGFSQKAAFYQAQITQYKSTIADPDKIERLVLTQLEKSGTFQGFMAQNGQMAGIFANPANAMPNPANLPSMPAINGIPSRSILQQYVKQHTGDSTIDPAQVAQQQAPSDPGGMEVAALKNKLSGGGGQIGNADANALPNSQSTKSFKKRLEYGFNLQFGSSTNYLPATSDFGFQVGYRLSDKFSVGVGASYTMGLGTGWNEIRISNNALGLRSYLKYKPSKTFFLQGGSEWNYTTAFTSIAQLRSEVAWQQSALIGIGRDYRVSKKINGSILLLYDFLYSQHVPQTAPFSFRIGYNF